LTKLLKLTESSSLQPAQQAAPNIFGKCVQCVARAQQRYLIRTLNKESQGALIINRQIEQ
jgi:hypothetical protein